MRTLPLSSITGPFPRAVRDLAAAQGKEVELEISGAETQLDRVILDGISESIGHMLRNAVAHGIEPPEERERAGKPALRARGAARRAARRPWSRSRSPTTAAAWRRELAAREATDGRALADVLAQAGFSTADEVSEVSGRGVGLDAVKEHVESLGGSSRCTASRGAAPRSPCCCR